MHEQSHAMQRILPALRATATSFFRHGTQVCSRVLSNPAVILQIGGGALSYVRNHPFGFVATAAGIGGFAWHRHVLGGQRNEIARLGDRLEHVRLATLAHGARVTDLERAFNALADGHDGAGSRVDHLRQTMATEASSNDRRGGARSPLTQAGSVVLRRQ